MKRLLNHLATATWKRLTIYCVSFISVFITGITLDLACGPEEDPYDYHLNFFHNNLQGGKAFKSFYYTDLPLLYDDSEPADESMVNSWEWAGYLGDGVTADNVKNGLYDSPDLPDAEIQKKYSKHHKQANRQDGDPFFRALLKPKNAAARKYYHFAKSVEPIANFSCNKWDDTGADVPALEKAAKKALANALKEKDAFLKLRYLYQAQRLLHYSGDYEQAAAIYDKNISRYQSKSHIKDWALAFKAGEERRMGNSVKAAYYFSKIFALCPEKRTMAYKNYLYIKAPVKAVLKMAANNKERAYIAAIEGFNTPGADIKPLYNVYRYYPASPMVGVLLIREINKLEDNYLTAKLGRKLPYEPYRLNFSGMETKSTGFYRQHIARLKEFCKKLSAGGKYPEPGLGNLAIAYLCWMDGKSDEAATALNQLNGIKISPKLDDQRHLLKLMLAAQSVNKTDTVNGDSLLNDLQWLDKRVFYESKNAVNSQEHSDVYPLFRFAASTRDFYQFVLTPGYLKQRDTLMGALTILKSEPYKPEQLYTASPWKYQILDFWSYYLRSGAIKKIIGLKHHRPDDHYLQLLTQRLKSIPDNYLYDLLGTAYLREHQYQKAIYALQKVSHDKITKKSYKYAIDESDLAYPFIETINDYPKTFSQEGAKLYNKLDFAKAMLSLEKGIENYPQNAASNYYKMAVGLYNTSFSGNSSNLISYYWASNEPARRKRYVYDSDYLRSSTAEKYFVKAGMLSNNAEFKAKCTFMAAKCRQKQVLVPGEIWIDYTADYERAVRMNPYFKTLRKGYSGTSFYKLAVHECSYLRDYLASAEARKK